ncbi:hypothetical protein SU69_07085 [Thermosipho melanesiensis]|uniref:Uncharacterized protein n=2 Tax=Thermosipho melanesiensis TaxID=46541 RepID=A6LMU5_THEM4|nr:LptA/OstA family protein [Thermosipho melanesiensis]ABR31246.1 hypothetical protein Tmel_1399 [Thermosipho melanesiensis BI429]APT74330.1 hypothetical protein BW47_07410 [Thermosipho melanesiensis]OOC36270.1 hypothetical protein SU68_07155 [Thermosipho melanesiensis]OOC37088.1 hypothetical protein SU69_07085 [Thermosipho melanesiensis]OOC37840.1 hypothetical protein SU70_07095 [Thermosipho melanesiensis]
MKKILLIFFLTLSLLMFSKTIHVSSDYIEPTDYKIKYEGNIVLKIDEDNLKLYTNKMVIEKTNNKWNSLTTEDNVKIIFENGIIEGDNLEYNIEVQSGILKNASLTIHDSKSSETIYIKCENLNFDLKDKTFEGTGKDKKITIIKGSIIAKAFKFNYNRAKGEIILEKNVDLKDDDKKIKLLAKKIIIFTETNNMKGENVQIEILVE